MKKDLRFIEYNSTTGEYVFNWSTNHGFVSGRDRLIQNITKRILTERGSNTFSPEFGSNFYNLFGVVDYSKEQQVKEAVPVMLKNIEELVIAEQAIDTSLTTKEKLRAINLAEIELDEVFGAWVIKIEIVTQDGVTNKFSVI